MRNTDPLISSRQVQLSAGTSRKREQRFRPARSLYYRRSLNSGICRYLIAVTNGSTTAIRHFATTRFRRSHVGTEESLVLLTQSQGRAENEAATTGTLSIESCGSKSTKTSTGDLAGGRSRIMIPIQQSRV